MNFGEALKWLYGFQKLGIQLGLKRIQHLMNELGNPHNDMKIVHVAGTNGKGSVCRLIESILQEGGYSVGMYLSPHLQRFSERVTINNQEISEDNVASLVNAIKPIVDEMIKEGNTPTFFELVTAMAFQYFHNKNVDFAVIEVGLGGRYDATNIVDPLITIITNVSLEHEKILGKKVKDIAGEKAGIIKKGVPVVTAATGDALSVVKEKAADNNASLEIVDSKRWKRIHGSMTGQEFLIKGSLTEHHVNTPLLGQYQGENITLATATIEQLQMNGMYLTDDAIIKGIEKTVNPGRMEIVGTKPTVLLDGAHNIVGIELLKKTLEEDFVYEKLILVLGILSDKNIQEMLDIITPLADTVIVTKSHNKRACNPSKLKELIGEKEVVVKDEISDAIDHGKKIAKKQDLICITGSLFTVGEVKGLLVK